jgi:hypothetical protein
VFTAAFLLLVAKIYSDSSFGHFSYSDVQITPAAPAAPQSSVKSVLPATPEPTQNAEKPIEKKPDEKPEEKKPEEKNPEEKPQEKKPEEKPKEKKPEDKKPEEKKPTKKPNTKQEDRDKEEAFSGEPNYFKNQKEWNWEAPLVPSTEPIKPEEILILTASNGGGHNAAIPDLLEKVCDDRDKYAKRNGYTHLWLNTDNYYVGDVHPVSLIQPPINHHVAPANHLSRFGQRSPRSPMPSTRTLRSATSGSSTPTSSSSPTVSNSKTCCSTGSPWRRRFCATKPSTTA